MAERKKTAHDEVVYFEHVADEQMATWPARSAVFRWVPPAVDTAHVPLSGPQTRTENRNLQRAAGYTRPELRGLMEPNPAQVREIDPLRAAFAAFLERANWMCERCGAKVESATLKVPPPQLVDGQPVFRMFCSAACAQA